MAHTLFGHVAPVLLGTALVVGLFWMASRARRRPALADYALTPLPSDIIMALNDVPPLQQTRTARAYHGRAVRWRVSLEAAFPSGLTTLRVMCQDRGAYPWVVCDVRRGRYPQLRTLEKHAPLWILGQIARIQGDEITLRHVSLEFGP